MSSADSSPSNDDSEASAADGPRPSASGASGSNPPKGDSGPAQARSPEGGPPREGPLHQRRDADEPLAVVSFSAAAVYETVRVEGLHEMLRPPWSLWWSGVAAGLAMIFSVVTPVFLLERGAGPLVSPLGYTIGFLIVISGRMQLFTENTITTVLPLLSTPSLRGLFLTARLWSVVFAANLVGGGLAAVFFLGSGLLSPDQIELLMTSCEHGIEGGPASNFARSMPAGFLIAGVVWLTRVQDVSQFLVISALIYVMNVGHFGHVIAGSIEAWFLVLGNGQPWFELVRNFVLPALLGNIVGGTGLFALLSYGQVRQELEEAPGERPELDA